MRRALVIAAVRDILIVALVGAVLLVLIARYGSRGSGESAVAAGMEQGIYSTADHRRWYCR